MAVFAFREGVLQPIGQWRHSVQSFEESASIGEGKHSHPTNLGFTASFPGLGYAVSMLASNVRKESSIQSQMHFKLPFTEEKLPFALNPIHKGKSVIS